MPTPARFGYKLVRMNTTRRGFLASLAAAPQLLAQNPRDVRIVDVAMSREDYTI